MRNIMIKFISISFFLFFVIELAAQPNTKWAGTWVKDKTNLVIISNVTENSFYYAFDCFNGRNIGQAEGTAIINGNEAISKVNSPDDCIIKFILMDDYIDVIDIRENDCIADAGMGVYYNGEYISEKIKQPKYVISYSFDRFFNNFKTAIINKEKEKTSDMIEFPIKGDITYDWIYGDNPEDRSNNIPKNNKKEAFIRKGFDEMFLNKIDLLKEIKLTKKLTKIKKSDIKYLLEEKTNYNEEIKDYRDIICWKYGDGKYGCSNWCYMFYFGKINGIYKLIMISFAG